MKKLLGIRRAIVESDAEKYELCTRILQKAHGIPIEKTAIQPLKGKPDSLEMEKDTLRLVAYPGEILKPCPGTHGYLCCGYQVLTIGTNCPLDCAYCVLQAYFNQPYLRVFVNIEERIEEIGLLIDSHPQKIFRIGTGEFTDSLALDPIVEWSRVLIPFIQKHRNAVLEFKTKTTRVERLLSIQRRDRIIVSWSLNSPYIASVEEHGAPSIQKRLKAAKRCQAEGFALGFHFDPLIEHHDWKDSYRRTIELLDKSISTKGIAWVSLGCFRFMPLLKPIIRKWHPGSRVLRAEFILGMDGKMRYFKPVRIEMYRFMMEHLTQWHSDCGLYLCMESDDVWEMSMGWSPKDSDGLSRYLDQRARKIFELSKQDSFLILNRNLC
jgi:spore photoproduct lyase